MPGIRPEVMFVKRMLQVGLPRPLRSSITNNLFQRYVTCDERSFAEELYMNEGELRTMREAGMHLGSHGYSHEFLDSMTAPAIESDIELSVRFLVGLEVPVNDLVVCYPYGGYSADVLEVLRKRNVTAAVTINHGIACIGSDDPLQLPRIDTNHFPGGKAWDGKAAVT